MSYMYRLGIEIDFLFIVFPIQFDLPMTVGPLYHNLLGEVR